MPSNVTPSQRLAAVDEGNDHASSRLDRGGEGDVLAVGFGWPLAPSEEAGSAMTRARPMTTALSR